MVQGFLREPASLFDWYHSPALFAFPDWAIALVFSLAGLPNLAMPFAYAAVMVLGFSWLTGLVAAAAEAGSRRGGMIAGAAVFGLAWLLSLADPGTVPFVSFMTLPAFSRRGDAGRDLRRLARQRCRRPRSHPAVADACAAGAAVHFSDALELAWMLVPMAAGMILVPGPSGRRRGLTIVLPMLAAGAVGTVLGLLPSLFNPANSAYFHTTVSVPTAARAMIAFVAMNLGNLGSTACWWWSPGRRFRACWRSSGATARGRRRGSCGSMSRWRSGWGSRSRSSADGMSRRINGATAGGAGAGADVAGPAGGREAVTGLLAVGAVSLAGAVAVPIAANPFGAAAQAGLTEMMDCLAANGLTDGYGDYWSPREAIFRSGRAVHIAQLDRAQSFRFNFDADWFTRRADGRPFVPDFVVLDRQDPAPISGRFGPPATVLQCGQTTIWRYDHVLAFPP